MNGTYGAQLPYGQQNDYNMQAANAGGATAGHSAEPSSSMPASGAPANDAQEKPASKEEIGWYFVEQYYKTLCNEPGKLHVKFHSELQDNALEKVMLTSY